MLQTLEEDEARLAPRVYSPDDGKWQDRKEHVTERIPRPMEPADLTRIKFLSDPQMSPNGEVVAFVLTTLSEEKDAYLSNIWLVALSGGAPRRFTTGPTRDTAPRWSPDGTSLAFLSDREAKKGAQLYVMPANGGEPVRLTDLERSVSQPVWSPDGSRLAFASARHDDRDYDNARDIFLVAAEGGEVRRVTDTVGPAANPAFSPDGRSIAYVGSRQRNIAGLNARLYQIPTEGGQAVWLSTELDRSVSAYGMPMWSGDGRAIVFGISDRGNEVVYRVTLGDDCGTADVQPVIAGNRQVSALSGCPTAPLFAFLASDPTHPAELFRCAADGTDERQLTDCNREWREEVVLCIPELLRYRRDGVDLDCWVIKPAGYIPGQRYPALLNIHGGPHTQFGNTFFDEFQVYAGAGYVVIYTNPRGSQGYGEAFTRAVVGDWGGVDFGDVMAGLDEALQRCDFIDPDRLGVMGGSYGGYMTSWTVGHTNRFKAACSERALNTFTSFFGSSDIGPWFAVNQIGALPWENPQWYAEHSPLTYAQDITTPLLIMHSENDLRCPMEQAEQLFMTLKRLRREVLFICFPDETHELSRSGKPRHRLERFRHILEWFGGHLQSDVVALPQS
jgi:dipeptidyl aminopeptidase/acylaminoacyl peptidase